MKISNFRDYSKYTENIVGSRWMEQFKPGIYDTEYAVVDVETRKFFFLKYKESRHVYRQFSAYWKFTSTDEYTPGDIVEKLCKEYLENK